MNVNKGVVLLVALGATVVAYGQDRQGFVLQCAGPAGTIEKCLTRANEVCGDLGFDVIESSTDYEDDGREHHKIRLMCKYMDSV